MVLNFYPRERQALESKIVLEYLPRICSSDNIFWRKYPHAVDRPIDDTFFSIGTMVQHLVLKSTFQFGSISLTSTIRLEYQKKPKDRNSEDLNMALLRTHRFTISIVDHRSETGRMGACEIYFTSNQKNINEYESIKTIFIDTWDKAIKCHVCSRTSPETALRNLMAVFENNKHLF